MKKVGKSVFFVVLAIILVLGITAVTGIKTTFGDNTKTYIKGVDTIRWGIDIRGGVDVTFTPPEDVDATPEQMRAAESVIKLRLVNLNITDYEVYTDESKDRIIVRFPWKEGETDFNPQAAIAELGATAMLTFREGMQVDADGRPAGETLENVILTGNDVVKAEPALYENNYVVSLTLSSEGENSGKDKFAKATGEMIGKQISIWMDDIMISAPVVNDKISDGSAMISGSFTADGAIDLANKINSGALPFKLQAENYRTINPTLGLGARDAMLLAGIIAFVLIGIFIIALYRLPGAVAMIALAGQVIGTIMCLTGYLPTFNSFTLTLPGMAGIILAIGIGVDANIITAERIKEELRSGKTLDGAIETGFKRGFTAVFDGNVTVIIIALILMGSFGSPDSLMAMALKPVFFAFPATTAGAIYSFGYTLLVGVIMNFVFGVFSSRLMLKSLSHYKAFRNPALYGGVKNEK